VIQVVIGVEFGGIRGLCLVNAVESLLDVLAFLANERPQFVEKVFEYLHYFLMVAVEGVHLHRFFLRLLFLT